MPLVKVSELTGAALDWAVAKLEGKEIYLDGETPGFMCLGEMSLYRFSPTKYWAQGGPIIEWERIDLLGMVHGAGGPWTAAVPRKNHVGWRHLAEGPTPLIAAMRCYVASKLGEEIEIPKELT